MRYWRCSALFQSRMIVSPDGSRRSATFLSGRAQALRCDNSSGRAQALRCNNSSGRAQALRCNNSSGRAQALRCDNSKTKLNRGTRHAPPRGFTLLEVVVGLILMATVLVGALLSFSSHQRQLAFADKRIAAVSYADEILARLTAGQRQLPRSMRGTVAEQPNWYWETSVVGTTAPMNVPVYVVRFRVVEVRPDGSTQMLTSVDVVEPIDLPESTP